MGINVSKLFGTGKAPVVSQRQAGHIRAIANGNTNPISHVDGIVNSLDGINCELSPNITNQEDGIGVVLPRLYA